ncbi:hypothetical protein F511_42431, partial [Dorcoceras hygrometricum]
NSVNIKTDTLFPKALESTMVLDVNIIACGEADTFQPKLVETLSGMRIGMAACGLYHTCAITLSGDLYTWGDGSHGCGFLGHGSEASHLGHGNCCGSNIPREVEALTGSRTIRVACGVWHTAAIVELTSQSSNSGQSGISLSGKLFAWGERASWPC